MAECGRRALSLLEAARSRYESLQISDDVFGESGDDSSENPFYSTTGDSNSDSCAEASERASGAGAGGTRAPPPGSASAGHAELKEGEEDDGWNDALQDTDTPHYKDTQGPTQKMPATATAMDFFQLFVPDNVIQNMVTQTNMYAKKYQERFGSDEGWTNVTPAEMKAFLGFVISTSVQRCESVLSIWSSGFFSNRSIALKMSQARFEKILKYFHIVAFRSSQGGNQGLYKIQPFLDSLQQSFSCAFRPSQTQVLHEPLIDEDPVFITTCTERELRKRKKRKFSLWVRQCSSTGFICQVNGLDTLKNKPQLHSLVARQLCQNLSGRNAIIFTGPSITSLSLFQEFENQDIYCCGLLSTRKSDCTGLPASMLRNPEGLQQRGQSHIKMKGNMSVISWYNKGNFRFLSNAYSPIKQDLEKAYDTVPREELWYCMRKSGVAEKYVRVVQDMYERSRTVVRCAVGQTEEFKVEVGLHQGSALSPFLFAIVMDQLSEEVKQKSPWTMMFADDIVICSESREQVEENLERWRFALERRGMKVSRSKTEYMCVNEREGSGTVRLQGEEVKKVQEFKYLRSTVQSNGECGKEVKKRVQAGVIIKRKSGEIPCPLAVEAFAAHLSYICKYDDKYSKYFIFHKPNKTWQQVFWLTISIAINNAYILYKMSDAYHAKRYSRAQF
ncbi:hypothetical protein QTP70_019148, partial [Hemibagrus guttatus]